MPFGTKEKNKSDARQKHATSLDENVRSKSYN